MAGRRVRARRNCGRACAPAGAAWLRISAAKSRTGWRCASSTSMSAPWRQPRHADPAGEAEGDVAVALGRQRVAHRVVGLPAARRRPARASTASAGSPGRASRTRERSSRWRTRRGRAPGPAARAASAARRSSRRAPAAPRAVLNRPSAERSRRSATRIWCSPSGSRASRVAASFSIQWRTQAPRIVCSASSTVIVSLELHGARPCARPAAAPVTSAVAARRLVQRLQPHRRQRPHRLGKLEQGAGFAALELELDLADRRLGSRRRGWRRDRTRPRSAPAGGWRPATRPAPPGGESGSRRSAAARRAGSGRSGRARPGR